MHLDREQWRERVRAREEAEQKRTKTKIRGEEKGGGRKSEVPVVRYVVRFCLKSLFFVSTSRTMKRENRNEQSRLPHIVCDDVCSSRIGPEGRVDKMDASSQILCTKCPIFHKWFISVFLNNLDPKLPICHLGRSWQCPHPHPPPPLVQVAGGMYLRWHL